MRIAEINRKTNETDIKLKLNLDGKGINNINTGCGFLDHMLVLFSSHSRIDLGIYCKGDTHIDYHHTVEDIGICLGKGLVEALGDKKGIFRYGSFTLPMDEALITVSLDISGRGLLCEDMKFNASKVGDFDVELCKEFMMAFSREAGITLHILQLRGENTHHIIEGVFKALSRALRQSVAIDKDFSNEIPSTKGMI